MSVYYDQYSPLVIQAATKYGVPPAIALGVAQQESGFNPTLIGTSGEVGIMQLMPITSQHLNVNPYAPSENIDGGVRFLKELYDQFGTWPQALSAYNTGSATSSVGATYAQSVIDKGTAITSGGNVSGAGTPPLRDFLGNDLSDWLGVPSASDAKAPGVGNNQFTGAQNVVGSVLGIAPGSINVQNTVAWLLLGALVVFGVWRLIGSPNLAKPALAAAALAE